MRTCPECQSIYGDDVEVCPNEDRATLGLSGDDRAAAPPDDLIGRFIGGYRISGRIGQGGMGAVYAAVHPTLGKRVAIKVLLAHLAASDDVRRRFFDEARAIATLDSPHIVTVGDLATLPDGRAYILMEHLEGESLGRMWKRRGLLPPHEAVAIAVQALDGLAVAHAAGIVHRDVKPANLFVARGRGGPLVKVLDFGVAKLRPPEGLPGHTRSNVLIGTPGYMAPEQAAGDARAVDARADLYSLAVVLYGLLDGDLPFAAGNAFELLRQHRQAPVPPLTGVPPALEEAVRRALAKQPDDRFADAAAMRAALIAALGGAALVVPEPTTGLDPGAAAAPAPVAAQVAESTPAPVTVNAKGDRSATRYTTPGRARPMPAPHLAGPSNRQGTPMLRDPPDRQGTPVPKPAPERTPVPVPARLPTPEPLPPAEPRRWPWLPLVVGAALLLGSAVAAVLLFTQRGGGGDVGEQVAAPVPPDAAAAAPPEPADGPSPRETDAALRAQEEACASGKAAACHEAGRLHARAGRYAAAADFYGKSCDGRVMVGCHDLAYLLRNGRGVAKDPRRAEQLAERACDHGIDRACALLALMAEGGEVRDADPAAARRFSRRACDSGNPVGCGNLGRLLEEGRGGKVDLAAAVPAYRTGCEGEFWYACWRLAMLYRQGRGVAADPVEARRLSERGCAGGHGDSCEQLAYMIDTGEGGDRDPVRATQLHEQACAKDVALACHNLAVDYQKGEGGRAKDMARAVALFSTACAKGWANSCVNAGIMLENADGVPADPDRALTMYRAGCEGAHMIACARSAWLLTKAKDYKAAHDAAARACTGGEASGCRILGVLFEDGKGMPRDDAGAARLYKQACDGGDQAGCDHLKDLRARGRVP